MKGDAERIVRQLRNPLQLRLRWASVPPLSSEPNVSDLLMSQVHRSSPGEGGGCGTEAAGTDAAQDRGWGYDEAGIQAGVQAGVQVDGNNLQCSLYLFIMFAINIHMYKK